MSTGYTRVSVDRIFTS